VNGLIFLGYYLLIALWQGVIRRILQVRLPPGAGGRVWLVLNYFPNSKRHFVVDFKLPGETELGNAEEQPNKG
jgi:hypothetical protein